MTDSQSNPFTINPAHQLTGGLSEPSISGFGQFWYIYMKRFSYQLVSTSSETKLAEEELRISIENNNTHYIKLNKRYEFGSVFAVQDSNPRSESRRYLVLFSFANGCTNVCLTGVFVYFNNSTETSVKGEPIISALCNYDWRNGKVRAKLYDETLFLTQTHRDSHTELCFLCLFDTQDYVIGTSFIFTNIKSDRDSFFNDEERQAKQLLLQQAPPKYHLLGTDTWVDMSSLAKIEGNYRFHELSIHYYKTSNPLDLDATSEPNDMYTDGYPNTCVICSGPTSIGSFVSKYRCIFMSLGSGICTTCDIRYSRTDSKWICCKVIRRCARQCGNTISEGLPCTNPKHSTKEKLESTLEGEEVKYPFKKRYRLTVRDVKISS